MLQELLMKYSKKVLLLGSNNFITDYLIKLSDNEKINYFFLKEKILKEDLEMDDIEFFQKYLYFDNEEFDTIILSIHFPIENLKIDYNVKLAQKIYTYLKTKNSKLIYISSIRSNPYSNSEYGLSKFNTEKIINKYDNFVIIRPSTIIHKANGTIFGGKKGITIKKISNIIKKYRIFLIPGSGKQQHTYCTLDSLCKFIRLNILENYFSNTTVNFFSGEYISFKKFINLLALNMNIRVKLIFIPLFFFKILFYIIDFLNMIGLKKITNVEKNSFLNLFNDNIEYDYTSKIEEYINDLKI